MASRNPDRRLGCDSRLAPVRPSFSAGDSDSEALMAQTTTRSAQLPAHRPLERQASALHPERRRTRGLSFPPTVPGSVQGKLLRCACGGLWPPWPFKSSLCRPEAAQLGGIWGLAELGTRSGLGAGEGTTRKNALLHTVKNSRLILRKKKRHGRGFEPRELGAKLGLTYSQGRIGALCSFGSSPS